MKRQKTVHIEIDIHLWLSYEAMKKGTTREIVADKLMRPYLSQHAETLAVAMQEPNPQPEPNPEERKR